MRAPPGCRDPSKDYYQPQLNLTRRRVQRINRSSAVNRFPGLIEQRRVGDGCLEIGPVEDVEKLEPQLHHGASRRHSQMEVLEEREIEIGEARSRQPVSAGVAKPIQWNRRGKAIEVDVVDAP